MPDNFKKIDVLSKDNGFGQSVDVVTDEALVAELQKQNIVQGVVEQITGMLNNVDFLIDGPWIKHVIKGFTKPDIESRLQKQLKKGVRKKLMDEASEHVEPGESIKTPTAEVIDAEVNILIAKRTKDIKEAKDLILRKARAGVLAAAEAADKPEPSTTDED